MVKNPPAKQEIWVHSLGQEDPLVEEMTTHSSILAWEIPWTEKPGGLQSHKESHKWGHKKSDTTATNKNSYNSVKTILWVSF